MANSADLDQSEANWSGSTLYAKAGHIQVQQDKDKFVHNIHIQLFDNTCIPTQGCWWFYSFIVWLVPTSRMMWLQKQTAGQYEQKDLSNFGRGPPKEQSNQVWLKSTE